MPIGVAELGRRFGLAERRHRIGELDLRFDEVVRSDDLVREIYPEVLAGSGDAPTWPVCWPAAFGLAEHVVHDVRPAGRKVLELGCGSAVPAVAAERAGAEVLATDRDPLALALAAHNARRNGCTRLRLGKVDWFSPPPLERVPLILGADIIYLERTYDALLGLAASTLSPGGSFILSDPLRPQMTDFLERARACGWAVDEDRWRVHFADASHEGRIRILTRDRFARVV